MGQNKNLLFNQTSISSIEYEHEVQKCFSQKNNLLTIFWDVFVYKNIKGRTPFYQFVAHNDLAKKIAELTEDLEELKSEKTMLLSSFDCSEDTGIAEVKKTGADF